MSKPKKRFSAWNILWIVPLLAILAAAVLMYVIPAFETVDKTAVSGSADWMARLPDERPLTDVVLPGTHDSATQYVQLAYFSKCQALSIGEQLESGFRYLDIRLGDDGEGFKLVHGFTSCTTGGWPWSSALKLDEVLDACYAFLDAHPTETIVFCAKHEHGDSDDAAAMSVLMSYIDKKPEAWYLGGSIPTVGEARGKLVLLRRFGTETDPGVFFKWVEQGGHEDTALADELNAFPACRVYVQDRYEYPTEEKWAAFTAGIEAQRNEGELTVSFLSTKGTASYGHPYAFAVPLNRKLMEYPGEKLSGWVMVDYASAGLAEHIYGANFD